MCISLVLTSCAVSLPQQPPLPDPEPVGESAPDAPQPPPAFQLETLPDLPPYVAPREIVNRYYNEPWVGELRPAKDYGILYPYVGKIVEGGWYSENRYGLADSQGRIVVDPVYRRAEYILDEALLLEYPVTGEDELARFVLASPDGRRINAEIIANDVTVLGQRLAALSYPGPHMDFIGVQPGETYRIYDTQGCMIEQGEEVPEWVWDEFRNSAAEIEDAPPDLAVQDIRNLEHVAGDVYSIRTTMVGGLIRENGEWLLRVYINNLD